MNKEQITEYTKPLLDRYSHFIVEYIESHQSEFDNVENRAALMSAAAKYAAEQILLFQQGGDTTI